ncbi:MAG: hypothetical protein FJY85_02695, partial [Deltaproteobacteria bacterium]|nr:hypothetical protein [Deltaproteobacteria bacterium]
VGCSALLVWLCFTTESRPQGAGVWEGLKWLAAGLLLYVSHALCFVVGVVWLVLSGTVLQRSLRGTAVHLLYLLPLFVATWFWYPMLSTSSMATPPLWVSTPLDRVSFSWLSDAALGGLKGPVESIVFGIMLAWIAVGIVQNRRALSGSADRSLLLAGCLFLVLSLVLPDKYMNTIRFGQRWVPLGMIMILLAVPAPACKPITPRVVAVATVAAFCAAVSSAWLSFERKELSGLQQALDALPASSRVLGLAFVQESDYVKGFPFIQTFAYSQVLKGGTLNFSFAEFSPCLVVYKKPFVRPWTGGLEWFPRRVEESDLDHFDHALICADDDFHSRWARHPRIAPVTGTGRWRLYRILPESNVR